MNRGRRQMIRRTGVGLLLILGGTIAVGRLAGFGCAARNATAPLAASQPSPADRLEGTWAGTWSSTQNDMGGDLRCGIKKLSEGAYQARFDAVFAKVLTHQSTVTLNVRNAGDVWEFSGQEDLGLLSGGVYKYQGQSDGHDFTCTYDSSFDKGTFQMTRLSATTQPANGVPSSALDPSASTTNPAGHAP